MAAFEHCSSLTNIIIPDSVTTIAAEAFNCCYDLESLTIGSGVTKIGDSAFSGCSGLKSVTIGNGITEVGVEAFRNCIRLEEVYCKATTPPSLGSEAFAYNNASGSRYIYVPTASVSAYKSTSGWSNYKLSILSYDF